jgi:hypothetical protein
VNIENIFVTSNETIRTNAIFNEAMVNGSGFLNLIITDADFETILNFGILSGNKKNVFPFNLLSDNLADSSCTQYQAIGQVYVIDPLYSETTSMYTLVYSHLIREI